jgi:hypothetical protein
MEQTCNVLFVLLFSQTKNNKQHNGLAGGFASEDGCSNKYPENRLKDSAREYRQTARFHIQTILRRN